MHIYTHIRIHTNTHMHLYATHTLHWLCSQSGIPSFEWHIIMEYCDKGSLSRLLSSFKCVHRNSCVRKCVCVCVRVCVCVHAWGGAGGGFGWWGGDLRYNICGCIKFPMCLKPLLMTSICFCPQQLHLSVLHPFTVFLCGVPSHAFVCTQLRSMITNTHATAEYEHKQWLRYTHTLHTCTHTLHTYTHALHTYTHARTHTGSTPP